MNASICESAQRRVVVAKKPQERLNSIAKLASPPHDWELNKCKAAKP
ncbi:predicted protein [Botrytis cinerea T4]|uniref:Uncharacterized protein n=1 Tax=Botryotinia fuckeliana (strain T4) TaxID=999810 RepID=G2YK12_BOTF4|nr:predicted protein [Botrytis cinerea T4]